MPAHATPLIRIATAEDMPAVSAIYSHYVRTSTCTYQEEPETIEDRRAWFAAHGPRHPITVAVSDGQIVGWGCLSRFRDRSAYDRTAEDSVYVHHALHGRGIGSILLADLIERARSHGHHTLIGGIDAEQATSVALHAKFGFVEVARFREVGFKFGRWLDVIFMQLML